MGTVETRIRRIIADLANLPLDMPGDANLYLDLGLASVYALQLLSALEQQFDVSVPDEDFVDATTILDLTALMERLTTKADSTPPAPEGVASA
jgi:acyl carrier protein